LFRFFAQHLPEPHTKRLSVELFLESNENNFLSAETIAEKGEQNLRNVPALVIHQLRFMSTDFGFFCVSQCIRNL